MLTFAKPVEQISEADLRALIESFTPESRTLEFKRELPGKGPDDKKEFLRDIVAFANSEGGHILYGVDASEGIATALIGLSTETADSEILRLEQMIRSGIEPIIHGLKIQRVPLGTQNRIVLVIEIPAALFGLHMLRSRGAFVRRTSAGKSDMDFSEIRSAFVGGETAVRKLDEFRQKRISCVKSSDTIVPVNHSTVLSLHILPLQSFTPVFQPDLARIMRGDSARDLLIPRKSTWGWQSHFTHHGFMRYCRNGNTGKPIMYANLFRNAAIEVVDADLINMFGVDSIPGLSVEWALLQMTQNLLRLFTRLEVRPPYYVLGCLLNVKGMKFIKINDQGIPNEERVFDITDVILPDVLIEDPLQPLERAFRPAIDVLWNASGWSGSPNYNTAGDYVPKWREHLL